MSHVLVAIDRDWRRFAATRSAGATLRRWRAVEPALSGVGSLEELTDVARDVGRHDLDGRDEIHRALLRLAAVDERAMLALLHLLYPALSATARIYADTWERDEAASRVVVAAVDYIRRCRDDRPRPAARLVRSVRRAIWKAAVAEQKRGDGLGSCEQLDEVSEIQAIDAPSSADEVLTVVTDAMVAGAIDRPKAQLLIVSRVLGVPTVELAAASGQPTSTIRQRRRRAEAAVADLYRAQVA